MRVTQSVQRAGFQLPADGDRVATSSVRPAAVINGLPERVEPAALLLMFNSYAAGVGKRQELVGVRSSRRKKSAKPVEPLRQVDPMGEKIRDAVLFPCDTSLMVLTFIRAVSLL